MKFSYFKTEICSSRFTIEKVDVWRKMRLSWFNRIGVFYFPKSFTGYLISLAAVAVAIYLFIDIDTRSHSASDTLMNWVFNCFLIIVAYTILAFFTSPKNK